MTIMLARIQRGWPGLAPLEIAIPSLWFAASFFVPEVMRYPPLGIALVGYLLFMAKVHRKYLTVLEESRRWWLKALIWPSVVAALIGEAFAIAVGNVVNISIFMFSKPNLLPLDLLNAAATLAAGIVVFEGARLMRRVRPLCFIGTRSLDIYLIHQFFLYPITLLMHTRLPGLYFAGTVLVGIVAAIFALALAVLEGVTLDRMPGLMRIIFPKDLAALRRSLALCPTRRDTPAY